MAGREPRGLFGFGSKGFLQVIHAGTGNDRISGDGGIDEIFAAVVAIRRAGTTVLLVEQRMTEALEIADRAYVLQTGRLIMQGTAAEISANAEVRKAYLGL